MLKIIFPFYLKLSTPPKSMLTKHTHTKKLHINAFPSTHTYTYQQ